jgi:tripartite-type tricarboxylate transporter receptor subunit TctC
MAEWPGADGIASIHMPCNVRREISRRRRASQDRALCRAMILIAGLAPAELAVMAGDVEAMLDSSMTSLQYIRDGRMRLLGLANVEAWPLAPDYPKISALLPGFQSLSFIGLFAARGTPPDLAAKLTEDFRAVLNEPELRQKLLDLGALPSSIGMSNEDFRKFLAADSKTWRDVIAAGKGPTTQQ